MRTSTGVLWAAVCLVLAAPLALAQESGEAPKPGPEHKRLGYFVGKWKSEGELKPNPFMPGGTFTSTDDCDWFEGGFAVVCHSEGTSPMGPTKGLGILSYSADVKAYIYYGVDNTGMAMATVPRGTVEGDTWTYTDEAMMGGVMVKSRYIMVVTSRTSYTFQWQMQGEDGAWNTLMEGKATKAS